MRTILRHFRNFSFLLVLADLAHADSKEFGADWDSLLPEPARIAASEITVLDAVATCTSAPIYIVPSDGESPFVSKSNAIELARYFGITPTTVREFDDDGSLATQIFTSDQGTSLVISPSKWRIVLRRDLDEGRSIVETDDGARLSRYALGVIDTIQVSRSDVIRDSLLQPVISVKTSRTRTQYGPSRPATIAVSVSRCLGEIPILGTPLVFAAMFPSSGTESVIFNWKPWKAWRNLELRSPRELVTGSREGVSFYGARRLTDKFERIEIVSARVVYMDDGIASLNRVMIPLYEFKVRYIRSGQGTDGKVDGVENQTVFAAPVPEEFLSALYKEAYAAANGVTQPPAIPVEPLSRKQVPSLSK